MLHEQLGKVLPIYQHDRNAFSLEAIGTAIPGGTLVFHMMGALAELERALIIERTQAELAAARKRGKVLGRLRKLTAEQVAHAREAIEAGMQTPSGMAKLLRVDRATLWRALQGR